MDWEHLKKNKKENAATLDLAIAIYELAKQIEDNNRVIKTLIQRVELLESKQKEQEMFLSEIDEKIIRLIEEKGRVTAEDVKYALKYKGKNAASARLNNLCKIGVLKKTHAGRKVYFFLNNNFNNPGKAPPHFTNFYEEYKK